MKSIQKQLMASLMLLAAFLMGTGGVVIYRALWKAKIAEVDAALLLRAKARSARVWQKRDRIMIRDLREGSVLTGEKEVFQFIGPDGRVLPQGRGEGDAIPFYSQSQGKDIEYFDLTFANQRLGRAVRLRFNASWEDDDEEDEEHERGERRARTTKQITLIQSTELESLRRQQQLLMWVLLGTGALVMALTGVFIPILVRRGLAPLSLLASDVSHLDVHQLNHRFDSTVLPEELVPIAEKLNGLLGRLQESFDRERQFNADVAHELRTPLAELRSLIEVHQKWPENDQSLKNALAEAGEIGHRMEGVVIRLLALCNSEGGRQPVDRTEVNLSSLARDVWSANDGESEKKGIQVVWKGDSDVMVETDLTLMRGILNNLISNAVEYSPKDGRIEITLGKTGSDELIAIQNTCPSITPDDVSHFFERFWRKDVSRTGEHAGLGLSLAQSHAGILGLRLVASVPGANLVKMCLMDLSRTKVGFL